MLNDNTAEIYVLLCFVCCFGAIIAAPAYSETLPSHCRASQELEAALRAQPSAPVYGAAGVWFAGRKNSECAIAAFEVALRVDPHSWETRYNLALQHIQRAEYASVKRHLALVLKVKPDFAPARTALGMALFGLGQLAAAEGELRAALSREQQSVTALDYLAQVLAAQRRYVAAISYWNKALILRPGDSNIKLSIAVAHSQNGEPIKAIELLEELVSSQPGFAPGHFNLATVYAHESRFRDAAGEYARAAELDSSDQAALLAWVKALTTIASYQEAIEPGLKYVERNPKDYEGHYLLGTIYRGMGDFPKAELSLRCAGTLNAGNSDVQYNLGAVLARLGKAREAAAVLENALKLNPHSSSTRFQLATVLRGLGEEARAGKIYSEFRELKKQDADQNVNAAKGNQANALMEAGEPLKAAAFYREMLTLEPRNGRTWYNLALALSNAGDKKGQREALEKAIAADPKLAPAHSELGLLDFSEGKPGSAELRFRFALDLDPQLAQAQGNLAVLRVRQNKLTEAETLLRGAIENDPSYTHAYLNLGLILAQQGRFRDAEGPLNKAVALAPEDRRVLTALGKVQLGLKKRELAIATLRKASMLDVSSVEGHLDLGIALADGFDADGAFEQFSQAVRLAPNSAAAHYNLGRALLDRSQYERALPELKIASRLAPSFAHTYFLRALAWKQSGHPERGVALLEMALRLEPANANSWFLLGQCLKAIGNDTNAIEAWKKAVAANPEHSESLYNLSSALRKSDPEQAGQYQKRFTDLQRQRQLRDEAELLGNFALASSEAHDFPKAIDQLRKAIALCDSCRAKASFHRNLGLVYCQSGDLQAGEQELRTALGINPSDPDARAALAIISGRKQANP